MRECSLCSRQFDDTGKFCPFDGAPLVACDPHVGRVLAGKYRIDALVGSGGMGAVYRATQLALERTVAIKVVRGADFADVTNAERFKREALSVAQLRHPHIVTIHDFGIAPDVGAYLVMEFLRGRSLRDELRAAAPLDVARAVEIIRQVCSAIHVAHVAGIVHRDLKPDNVFLEALPDVDTLDRPTVAKVLDFGVAKLLTAEGDAESSLTQPGAFIGTPVYTAPEQCAGEEIDGRADTYSLGCVLYEMLVGRPPFSASRLFALVAKHQNETPVPPRQLRPSIPPEVDAAILRALAKHPGDRFPTALDFARALRPGADSLAATADSFAETRIAFPSRTWSSALDMSRTEASALLGERTTIEASNNLPQQVTSFVEREAERAEIERLLDTTRLLTLTGPGGIGKTRMALRIATDVLPKFPGGVWLVELAALEDPKLVLEAVASVFGVRAVTGGSPFEALVAALRRRVILLVLDNCEHLLAACVDLVSPLLRACPDVKVLATSQEVLGIAGELTFRLPSMSLPSEESGDVESSEAVRLFVERARLAQPAFGLTDRNRGAIARLCRRLDGIPLAIELAAARVRVLSVDQILDRLDDRFKLLAGGNKGALPRQQTLLATMEWSYGLLSEPERALLRRLSVFQGGWTLEAAETMASAESALHEESFELPEEDARDAPHVSEGVFDLLARLADRSLVQVEQLDAGVRYRLLETIRQYAWDRLAEAGEDAAASEAHLAWALALAESGESLLAGPDEGGWFDRLELEHDNIRAALRRAGETPARAREMLRLACALGVFWNVRGYWAEGRRWLERALLTCTDCPDSLRGLGAYFAGCLALSLGDTDAAATWLDESLARLRGAGDDRNLARALNKLGFLLMSLGHYERVPPVYEESLATARRIGDPQAVAAASSSLAQAATDQGDYELAERCHEESLSIYRAHGNRRGLVHVLHNYGELLQRTGDLGRAETRLGECLDIAREIGDRHAAGYTLHVLGNVAVDRGDLATALERFREAVAVHRELGDRQGIAYVLEGLACASVASGDAARALRLFGAAERLRGELGAPLTPVERGYVDSFLARASAELGERAAAQAEEATLDAGAAVELGLSLLRRSP